MLLAYLLRERGGCKPHQESLISLPRSRGDLGCEARNSILVISLEVFLTV